MDVRHRVFARMWAVAVLAHLAGNWTHGDVWPRVTADGVVLGALGLTATWVILAPGRRPLLLLMGLVPVTVLLEAPLLGNHWLLAGMVSLGYLLTRGDWARFEPVARLVLLVFYCFAAFAKLNTGFLDPVVSCGVYHLDEALAAIGGGSAPRSGLLAPVPTWGPLVIELAVPVLLVVARTRRWGVLLALGFHAALSFDLGQHFYDFTAVLLPLFVLFLDDDFFERLDRLGRRVGERGRTVLRACVAVVGVTVTLANVLPPVPVSAAWLISGSFLWWTPYVTVVVVVAWRSARPQPLSWRVGPVGAGLVVLVVANGLTPYLEVKSAYGWHMYSNLVLVDGESNHLLVPRTWPLRDGHRDLVRIVDSSDEGLRDYVDSDYLLPWPSLRVYASERPDASVTYERAGTTVTVERVGDSDLGEATPWWWRWMPLRAVHGEEPETCLATFQSAL